MPRGVLTAHRSGSEMKRNAEIGLIYDVIFCGTRITRSACPVSATNRSTSGRDVVGREAIEPRQAAKTSLICSARNEPGALFAILRVFADNQINMIKLESRPIPGEPWKYMFYIDLEADLESPELAAVREEITDRSEYFKILGCY